MAALAREVGIAKGTLYLYFTTREEVLLALFMQQLEGMAERLLSGLERGMNDEDFCRHFYQQGVADPLFPMLAARLESVIEHNISLEAFCAMKRHMRCQFERISSALSQALALTPEQSLDLLVSLSVLLQGASQGGSGPGLNEENLPADVLALVQQFSAESVFLRNAARILAGVRHDT